MHGVPVRIQLNAGFSGKEMITFYKIKLQKVQEHVLVQQNTIHQQSRQFICLIDLNIFVQKDISLF